MAIRIGVVGVGFGTQVQIPGFQSEGYEVVAVCARREERAREAAARFAIPHVYTDITQLLKHPGLDAVSIVTPPHLHHQMGLAALQAGKHVLLEKPFALNVKEAWDLFAESKRRPGQAAMVGHEFRFAPPRAYIKELISQGYLGTLNVAELSLLMGMPMRPAAAQQAREAPGVRALADPPPLPPWGPAADLDMGGGLHKALGSHYIDCLRDWFGDVNGVSARLVTNNPDRLDVATGQIRKATADDSFAFTLTSAKGGWATMTASFGAHYGPGARLELFGTQGTLTTSHQGPNPTSFDKVLSGQRGGNGLLENAVPERHQAPADERDHRLPSFRILARRFERGIQTGTSPEPNFLDGFRSQQVLDGMLESHRTGRFVPIDLGQD